MTAVTAPIAGRLTIRYPASVICSIGLALLAAGLLLIVFLPTTPAKWDVVWRLALCGIGFGLFQTPNNAAMMTAGPIGRSGAASGMNAAARYVGWLPMSPQSRLALTAYCRSFLWSQCDAMTTATSGASVPRSEGLLSHIVPSGTHEGSSWRTGSGDSLFARHAGASRPCSGTFDLPIRSRKDVRPLPAVHHVVGHARFTTGNAAGND